MVDHHLSIHIVAGECHTGWRRKPPTLLMIYVTLTSEYSHLVSSEWKKPLLCPPTLLFPVRIMKALLCHC